MRRFSAAYLERSRETLWRDNQEALDALSLADHDRIVEVGAGTGQFTSVLAASSTGALYALDIDRTHLPQAAEHAEAIAGDATALPIATDAADLVVCQTLLTNLPEPARAVDEFKRASRGLIGAIEPDNTTVVIDSTVTGEAAVASRIRDAYLAGSPVDPAIGPKLSALFKQQGVTVQSHQQHEYTRVVEPPYSPRALAIAQEQATGSILTANQPVLRAAGLTADEYETLREDTRAVGRDIVTQMQTDDYRRRETVTLHVVVGTTESSDLEEQSN